MIVIFRISSVFYCYFKMYFFLRGGKKLGSVTFLLYKDLSLDPQCSCKTRQCLSSQRRVAGQRQEDPFSSLTSHFNQINFTFNERPDLRKVELSQGGCPVPTFGHTHTNGIFFFI